MADKKTQLAVIGAGPGGYAAAFLAADLGMEVTLIDPELNPGGVCLYRGCIPSKTLLHAARLIDEARGATAMGLTFGGPDIDSQKLRDWKNEVVGKLTGGLGQLVKRRKINYLRATASFRDSTSLSISPVNGGEGGTLSFEHAIIATGSRPAAIPGLDTRDERIIGSRQALDLAAIPSKLLVVGGGYIGLELGTVYAGLGAAVTVIEMMSGLLPGVDGDLVRFLHKRLEKKFEAIWLNTTLAGIEPQKDGLRVTLKTKDQDDRALVFDHVLIAIGRRPYTADLGLEKTGVQLDRRGFIQVDERRRTAEPQIYAIGDVAGEPMLAHKASHEGRVAVEAIAGQNVAFEPAAVPAVIFTHPEIAYAGLTEAQAKADGIAHEVARFPWGASSRAATLGDSEGLTKLLVAPESERILGIGIVGPGAGELIAEGVLAIEMGANVTDLGLTIHPHPTLSETLMEAAHVHHGNAAHYYRPRKKT